MTVVRRGAIVAIHGVGAPKQGEIIAELSTLFPHTAFVRNDIVVAGTTFARLEPTNGLGPDILEMNWSDIKRPPVSIFGVIKWTIALSLALARANFRWSRVRLWTGPMHVFFSETVLLWVTYPVLLGFMHENLNSYALASGDAAIFLMIALTYWMVRSVSKLSAISGGCAFGLALLLAVTLWRWPSWYAVIETVAIRAYGWAQIVAAFLITLTAIELGVSLVRGKLSGPGLTGRLAFAYLPLAMISAVGSCVWAICLNVVLRLRGHNLDAGWEAMFLGKLGFDLQWVEWSMAGGTFVLGCLAILAVIHYRFTSPPEQGRTAHRWICCLTVAAPICLSVSGTILAMTSPYFGHFLKTGSAHGVVSIYTWSALRILPWLVAAVSGLAVFLDVLSDVVFYVTDTNSTLSSFDLCNKRLEQLLRFGQEHYTWLHVVGHSQGTVIAHTTLREFAIEVPYAFTTLGSPLGPLYSRYLQWPVSKIETDWKNLFRSGDYIGGPIDNVGIDEDIGDGGHTEYWRDKRITRRLELAISADSHPPGRHGPRLPIANQTAERAGRGE